MEPLAFAVDVAREAGALQLARLGSSLDVREKGSRGDLVTAVVLALHRAGIRADDVQTETANLEDAFLALTDETSHDTNGATR